MLLHGLENAVGVRDLHDRLSEHLDRVERGSDIVVTRRGKPIARLIGASGDPLADLVRRGLVQEPRAEREARSAAVVAEGSVSALVREQRA